MKKHLLDSRFPLEIVRLTGLLNQFDQNRFQEHVVIPLRQHGQVFDFYGRYIGKDTDMGKHWRLPSDRLVVGSGYFNWNPRQKEIIVVEGLFDALSLYHNGFTNAVATWGTNGLEPARLKDTNIKRLWMCFDADSAGRERGLKAGYACTDAGVEVKIIELPDGLDPNDYFLKNHTADDFKALMMRGKSPEDWEIDNVPDELDISAKVDALKNVTSRAARKQLNVRDALIKKISEKTGLKENKIAAQVEEFAKQQEAESKTILNMDEYEKVHPALHLTNDGITLITVPMLVANEATKQTSLEPHVVTSQREMFPLTHAALNERKWYCQRIVSPAKPRYSQAAIEAYIKKNARGDLTGTYESIKSTYRHFLDFSDANTYDYLAAWTIGTYFFRSFDHYGYIHFSGTKEVGKSKAMRVMSQMCFNGIMAVSITDASQFRIITDLLPTLFLDESENLDDKTNLERRALLLGGYEKGSGVWRTDRVGDAFHAQEYENFSPRVFASIKNMEHVLASRTITIEMRRSFDDAIKNTQVKLNDPRFQEIRDELFLVAMDYGHYVKKIYDEIRKPPEADIEAREWDIFKPIYTIGTAVGSADAIRALVQFAVDRYREKLATYNETAPENVVLRVLLELVQEEKFYSIDEVHDRVKSFTADHGIYIGKIHSDELGRLLKKLGVVEDKSRPTVEGKRQTLYLMNPATVKKIAKNRMVIQESGGFVPAFSPFKTV